MREKEKCSFCGKTESETVMLVKSASANICKDCAEQATLIFREEG